MQLDLPLTKVYTVAVRTPEGIQHYEVQAFDEKEALAFVQPHFQGLPMVAVEKTKH